MSNIHHIWCNTSNKEPENCPMCERLESKYPTNGNSESELLEQYFPNVKQRIKD